MERKHNKSLVSLARILRRNMTAEERRLWYEFLKSYPVKFTRQKILGKYIADFYCARVKLVIELDGSQHFDIEQSQNDSERTAYLERFGVSVIRIPNYQIKSHFKEMCDYIDSVVQQSLSQLR